MKIILDQGFPTTDKPMLNPEIDTYIEDEGWEQGVGYTDEEEQSMFVKVNEQGIVVVYIAIAHKNALIFPWERISHINLISQMVGSSRRLLARIIIPGLVIKIYIPWNETFNQYVPDTLSFAK